MQQLTNGTLLQGGKYKIERFLSSGGFGNTYEGVHTMMDTRVAIKEFFPKMFCNRDENTSHVTVGTQGNRELVDKLRKKFNEEAKAVFQIKHDNIVRVLDIFEENGTAYYVMEYIDGKSLNEITNERGALPEVEAVGYIRQVAEALKYVHSLNRLHLDIKPGNIMVDKNGKAILIDFGTSKHYDMESGENTSTLMGVNTKGYAPIEQCTQSFTSFSPATDIYALGATLYKLLTGDTPPDANLLLAKEETLQPLPSFVSESTRNAVMSAMKLIRAERLQNVDDFMSVLCQKVDNDDTKVEGKDNSQNKIKKDAPKDTRTKHNKIIMLLKWIVGIIVTIIVLLFSVEYYKEKQAEEAVAVAAAEKARKESIAKKTTDWYEAGKKFYCMVEGKKYYVETYGIPDGQRIIHYSNGATFAGVVNGGHKSQGKINYSNGDYFEGTFTNGAWGTGYGKWSASNHSIFLDSNALITYEGNYQNGQKHGVGTCFYNDHTYKKCRFVHGKEVATLDKGTWR